eukprot:3034706-Ditylum_brightwellii.AAC.1
MSSCFETALDVIERIMRMWSSTALCSSATRCSPMGQQLWRKGRQLPGLWHLRHERCWGQELHHGHDPKQK